MALVRAESLARFFLLSTAKKTTTQCRFFSEKICTSIYHSIFLYGLPSISFSGLTTAAFWLIEFYLRHLGCRCLRTIVQPSISSGFMGILFSRMFPWLPSTSHNFRNCREYCGRSIGRQVADWEVLGWQWWGWAAVARRRPLACYSHASPMSVCPIITIYMPHNYQNIDLKLIDWRKISWRFEEWMCYFTATKFNSGPLITIAPLLHTKKNAQ